MKLSYTLAIFFSFYKSIIWLWKIIIEQNWIFIVFLLKKKEKQEKIKYMENKRKINQKYNKYLIQIIIRK